jgi:methylisocitrate lyase
MERAGADAVLVPSLSTDEEAAAVAGAVEVPVIYLTAETIRPIFSLDALERQGFAMAIYALSLIQVSAAAQQAVLRELMELGTTEGALDRMTPFKALNALVGVDALAAFERALTDTKA